ncbi:NAD(P)/FAD-dependent oxidoreductase [Cryptosporangium japonicum]|uniref:FAD-dependent oxidoreductase n=1 Tax=Cryptosporangium japonicum TaxID=80872 RepID=A0ABN0TKU8_9ACTN
MIRIMVVGAGYAGLAAVTSLAGRLRGRDDVRVTLVSASERFTERLRLHQVASGQRPAEFRIPALLAGTGVEFVRGRVTGLDAAARTVRVDDERELHYDTLVYALGAVADTDAVPGATDHADTLDTLDSATRTATRLASLGAGRVVVCGSGLTGVEAAAEIAESHPALRVTLLGRDAPGATLGPRARAHLTAALARLGVRVRTGVVRAVHPHAVHLDDGGPEPADLVLWTGGVRVAPLAADAGLDVDRRNRIVTDATLRSVSHPEIYAVGDAAAVRQTFGTLHGTCQSGMPTGVAAAVAIVRVLDGRAPKPFRFGYLHVPVSLGRRDAVVQFTRPDDSPRRAALTGRSARWYKETVSAAPWPAFGRSLTAPRTAVLGWRRGGRYTR